MAGFTIGKVAKAAGVGVETIRFYEKKGLIQQPVAEGTYRHYPQSVVERIRFIKRAQELDFSLAEILELLELADRPDEDRSSVREIARKKLEAIQARIAALNQAEATLSSLAESCTGEGPVSGCPIIDAFFDKKGQADT